VPNEDECEMMIMVMMWLVFSVQRGLVEKKEMVTEMT
jgi:hypothetical protein